MSNTKNPNYVPLKDQVRNCEWCGKTFIPVGHAQKWCSERCKKSAKKARVPSTDIEHVEAKKIIEKKLSITDIAIKAAELGISYGEYVGKNEYACKLKKKL